MTATDLVRSLLRPSESLACLLSVQSPRRSFPRGRRQLIALVVRGEVGILLFLNVITTDGVVRVIEALPITEHLALSVAQTDPVDSPSEESDPGGPTESWSAWLLTIRRHPQDTTPLSFAVRTPNTQNLQTLTAECRRLKVIKTPTPPVITASDFGWIKAYFRDPLSRRPDLRTLNQPLLSRLSAAFAGAPGDDLLDLSTVRHDYIEQAATKEASTSDVIHLKIRTGTFNVNGKSPSQDLHPWLRSSEYEQHGKSGWISPLKLSPFEVSGKDLLQQVEPRESDSSLCATNQQGFEDPDILVLGFQELDLSTEALLYTTTTLKEDEWVTAIFAGLGEKRDQYEKLTSRQLVGMLLIVIVKKDIVHCFTDVRSCGAGSGIMGFMGNKGATAVRLKFTPSISLGSPIISYRSTVLTFVNAHLAASDEMVERRNYDFVELSSRLAFSPNILNEGYSPDSFFEDDTYNIYQTDVLFWMVHLNYRLDLHDEDIRRLLFLHASGIDSIQTLLYYDQLRAAIRSKKAFQGFTEHLITHIPTYRLAPNLSRDRLGYDVKRKPAWTDRILYMTHPDVTVAQVMYKSHPEITMSDHQPVSADFDISLILIDQSKYEDAVSALHYELVRSEGSKHRPKIRIHPTSIEFGAIKYKQVIHREVVLRNDGEIPCVFRFVATSADPSPVSPSWLRIEPGVGLLRPQETLTIFLSAYVDNHSAARLNHGPSMLGCTLVLHTALGKDDFIAVSGEYQYTCFATTLERLTRLAGPIRKLASPDDLMPVEQAINAPREIMRLINWMMTHATATAIDRLFDHPAQEEQCHVIQECLDTGDEFPLEGPDGDHHALIAAFASTLVTLLDSLIEPVVPARLHAECLQARDKDEAFEVLNVFPHESINVWISLTAFLHYIAQHGGSKEDSSKRAQRLASVFAPILLRDDTSGVHPKASPVGKQNFLLCFIE